MTAARCNLLYCKVPRSTNPESSCDRPGGALSVLELHLVPKLISGTKQRLRASNASKRFDDFSTRGGPRGNDAGDEADDRGCQQTH
jgi:hypothetical protein